jgi:hypothetical protein
MVLGVDRLLVSSTSEKTYMTHALQNKSLTNFLGMSNSNLADLPICPRCETIGLRDKGWLENRQMHCPNCDYQGTATETLETFVSKLLFK